MADLSTVVELIFSGNADGARQAIDQISGDLGKLDSGIQGIAQPIGDFADSLIKAEAAALALGAAVAVLAVRETIQFQDSLYLVEKQLGDTGVSIEQARQDIESLGLTYGINANEVAQSVAGFLAAGYDYQTAARLVETSTQFMIAAEISAADATEILNRSIAGFRIPADQATEGATRIGDAINKVADISQGPITELAEAFARVSPTAKDAGLSIEETAAIVAKMVDLSYSGEQAATALKSGLLSLITPSKEAEGVLADLGIQLTGNDGQLKGSKILLEELAGKWGTLTDAQKQQTAAIVFGKEQAGAMSDVLGGWSKIQDYLNQLLNETTGAVGSMAREVEGKLKLISSQLATTNEAWRQFLENLGARITTGDDLSNLIGSVGDVGKAFKEVVNTGGFDPLIDLLRRQARDLTDLFGAVAQNLPEAFEGLDWSGLIDSLEGLGDTVGDLFESFFGEIDLSTVEGLESALQTVINTIEALTITVTGIVQSFQPFAEMIGGTVQRFNDLDNASQLDFGKFIGSAKLLVDAGTAVGSTLIAIGQAGIAMGNALDVVFGAAKAGINSLQVVFDAVVLGVMGPIAAVAKGLIELDDAVRKFRGKTDAPKSGLRQELEDILTGFNAVSENLKRNAQEGNDGLRQMGEGFGIIESAAGRAAEQGLSKARDAITAAGKAAQGAGGDLKAMAEKIPVSEWDGAIGGLRRFEDEAGNLELGDKLAKEVAAAKQEAEKLKAALENAINKDPIEFPEIKLPDNVKKITDVFQEAKRDADGYLKSVEGISTVYEQVGDGTVKARDAIDGTANAMQKSNIVAGQMVEKLITVRDASGNILSTYTDLVPVMEKGSGTFSVLGDSASDAADATKNAKDQLEALTKDGKLTVDQLTELTKVANDFEVKMEEIASNERIKTIEASVSLNIAQLEADMERAKAAFASIDNTISSTGDLIGDLFGGLIGTDDWYKEALIERQIREENKRRQEALDIQKKLAEAEIARIEAQTRNLERGDPWIRIDGTGLEPQLEAFMWEILKAIRTQVNAEFADFLLGTT